MKFEILNIVMILFICRGISATSMIIPKHLHITFKDTGIDLFKEIRFFLYTQRNYHYPQQLWLDNVYAIRNSSFNFNKPTKFVTHGWLNTYEGMSCVSVKKAFLARDDYNVIVVDWGNVAKLPYLEAAGRIKVIGGYVAKMIKFLESQGSDPNNMSLVGHSLGAQLMGLAGYQTINKVGHVVGLDPAGPGFEMALTSRRISIKDAVLVEVIHTSIDNLGIKRAVGHVDYYPNGGGPGQPGCENNIYCPHDRSYLYYAEALTRPESFLAVRCTSYARFLKGGCQDDVPIPFAGWQGVRNKVRGSYFLHTAGKEPFGIGLNGVMLPPSSESKKRMK